MPWSASSVWCLLRLWLQDYDRVRSAAVLLIYVQIACALVGSLGALYNGVLLINFMVALFALIAIESNSQTLGRTYAVLLACGILLDIIWFILFSHEIWTMSSKNYGQLFVFSLRLTLWMQIIGFFMRSLSSLLWIQIYRLGVSSMGSAAYTEADFIVNNNFLDPPTHEIARQNSSPNATSGGGLFSDQAYYSLLENAQEKRYSSEDDWQSISDNYGSSSAAEPSEIKVLHQQDC